VLEPECIQAGDRYEDKHIMKVTLYIGILLFSALGIAAQDRGLQTVPKVDLDRYAGKWYEIARYPNKFQKQCLSNVSATYTRKPNGRIEVLNECAKGNGKVDSAKGEAKIVDKTSNAKLKVRFAPGFLSAFGFVWGDYWVIDLGENYEYAVVGDPDREYLWILSRTSELPAPVYEEIVRRVEAKGFDSARLVKTPQNTTSASR
jgi:apolipoprotein D and lipocalin family protein